MFSAFLSVSMLSIPDTKELHRYPGGDEDSSVWRSGTGGSTEGDGGDIAGGARKPRAEAPGGQSARLAARPSAQLHHGLAFQFQRRNGTHGDSVCPQYTPSSLIAHRR